MFADTDFILALLKESDWLKENAVRMLRENRGKIRTSSSVMIEVAIVCKRFGISITAAFANALELVAVDEETHKACLTAAFYVEKYGLNVFDSFNAAYCGTERIISSDSAYEKVGIERVKLENKGR